MQFPSAAFVKDFVSAHDICVASDINYRAWVSCVLLRISSPLLGVDCLNHKLAIAKAEPFLNANPFSEWASTIREIAKASCEPFLLKTTPKLAPAAARNISPSVIHVIKCQACILCNKNVPAAAGKTAQSPIHATNIQEHSSSKKKTLAAAGKTSPD